MFKDKHVVIPIMLLVLLLAVGALRWKTEANKTFDQGVATWRIDRWTDQVWLKEYHGEGTAERPIGEKFKILDAPRSPGTGFDRLFLAPYTEKDPWGRTGFAKWGAPANEELQEYISRATAAEKETDTYRQAVEYFVAVEEWEQSVKKAEKNIENAWFLREGLTKVWFVLVFVSVLWLIIGIRKLGYATKS